MFLIKVLQVISLCKGCYTTIWNKFISCCSDLVRAPLYSDTLNYVPLTLLSMGYVKSTFKTFGGSFNRHACFRKLGGSQNGSGKRKAKTLLSILGAIGRQGKKDTGIIALTFLAWMLLSLKMVLWSDHCDRHATLEKPLIVSYKSTVW